MSTPFFSILIPVFNQEGKMDACLESVRAQDFDDYEVILVDDGSTDGSYAMLTRLAEADNRYSVYRHETNRSLLCARYTGMKNAAGEYILFLDSDDYLDSDTLSSLYAHIQENPVDIVRFGFVAEPIKYEIGPVPSDAPYKDFMDGKFPPQIVKNCISKRVIKRATELVTPFYCNSGEDTFMTGTLYALAESFSLLNRCFYHYYIVGGMSRAKESLNTAKLERILSSLNSCTDGLTAFTQAHFPAYADACKGVCSSMYRYEICHFLLNADDERMLIDFLNMFRNERCPEVFDYGCREVVPEFYKRRLGIYEGDKMKFNAF